MGLAVSELASAGPAAPYARTLSVPTATEPLQAVVPRSEPQTTEISDRSPPPSRLGDILRPVIGRFLLQLLPAHRAAPASSTLSQLHSACIAYRKQRSQHVELVPLGALADALGR